MDEYSTDDADIGKFRPHGRISFSFEGNLVVYQAEGPFNVELLEAFAQVEPEIIQRFQQRVGPWVEVIIFEKSSLAPDECIGVFGDYLKEMKANGLAPRASAMVIGKGVESSAYMNSCYEKCYREAGFEHRLFSNRDDALSWVKTFLPQT
ncbi:hypothetical protein [Spongiibacter sp.]|uniref:hypothetical protein n=1 Tax=Spongiibacter sp. TaxID=2024860 RepID=UPI0035686910